MSFTVRKIEFHWGFILRTTTEKGGGEEGRGKGKSSLFTLLKKRKNTAKNKH